MTDRTHVGTEGQRGRTVEIVHDGSGADDRGRGATSPSEIPRRGWWDILKRTLSEAGRDNVSIIAAGVAFLSLLAIFPAMTAAFSIYGLVADPQTVATQVDTMVGVLPDQGRELVSQQMHQLASQSGGTLSIGLVLGILLALWSGAGGVKALMGALNIAYEEEERRGFVRYTLTALALTVGFIVMLFALVAIVVVLPAVLGLLGLGETAATLIGLLRWPLLAVTLVFALAVLYRYAPCRATPQWRWVSWGSVAATLLWSLGSVAFSIYITNFADYNATYGSLGAAIILLLWLYLGAFAVLMGAELDSEMEHQTAKDTTTGPDRPLGSRGAAMADTVADRS